MDFWQVAAGSDHRCYTQSFLEYGMAFVGSDKAQTMSEVKQGDGIVLKHGTTKIIAAGEIVRRNGQFWGNGDKDWLRDFDGWDLSAYCYVDWHVPPTPVAVTGLTRATMQGINLPDVISAAQGILASSPVVAVTKPEPRATKALTDEEILDFLVREGLRSASAEEFTATFNRVRRLARYYYECCCWDDVREHETRTFLVAPLLSALGWSEQQMKIELPTGAGGQIDMACFSKPYRRTNRVANNDDCVLLLESKGFSFGLDYAHDQVKNYATAFPASGVVLATNGYCYKAFKRTDNGAAFSDRPSAYLNLLRPRDKYPLDPDNVDGGLELLRYLLPQYWLVRR